jgi:hypothetical protein
MSGNAPVMRDEAMDKKEYEGKTSRAAHSTKNKIKGSLNVDGS